LAAAVLVSCLAEVDSSCLGRRSNWGPPTEDDEARDPAFICS
jgi:hypothetical protein